MTTEQKIQLVRAADKLQAIMNPLLWGGNHPRYWEIANELHALRATMPRMITSPKSFGPAKCDALQTAITHAQAFVETL